MVYERFRVGFYFSISPTKMLAKATASSARGDSVCLQAVPFVDRELEGAFVQNEDPPDFIVLA